MSRGEGLETMIWVKQLLPVIENFSCRNQQPKMEKQKQKNGIHSIQQELPRSARNPFFLTIGSQFVDSMLFGQMR